MVLRPAINSHCCHHYHIYWNMSLLAVLSLFNVYPSLMKYVMVIHWLLLSVKCKCSRNCYCTHPDLNVDYCRHSTEVIELTLVDNNMDSVQLSVSVFCGLHLFVRTVSSPVFAQHSSNVFLGRCLGNSGHLWWAWTNRPVWQRLWLCICYVGFDSSSGVCRDVVSVSRWSWGPLRPRSRL